jgi:hypothetical protein
VSCGKKDRRNVPYLSLIKRALFATSISMISMISQTMKFYSRNLNTSIRKLFQRLHLSPLPCRCPVAAS